MNDMESIFLAGNLIRGQYRVIELLGKGASGAVYLVADEYASQKLYALKEVKQVVVDEQRGFPFDAAMIKRLNHPALPHVHNVFYSDSRDRAFILMDYVEGSNLEVLRQLMPGKRLSLHTAMTLLSPIMDAVSYLHRQQPYLVHGDIKPANIIAPIAGTSMPSKLVDLGGIRESGTVLPLQTRNFRAPEQFGKGASRRSDVYALGAVLYILLTGTAPAPALERMKQIKAGKPDPLWPVSQFKPFAQEVARAIHRAMSIDRHDRFASVEQFHETLRQMMHNNQGAQVLELAVEVPGEEKFNLDAMPFQTESLELLPFVPVEERPSNMLRDTRLAFPPVMPSAEAQDMTARLGPSNSSAGREKSVSTVLLGETVVALPHRKQRPAPDTTVSGRYTIPKRKKNVLFVSAIIFLIVCILLSGLAAVGYQKYKVTYQSETALAKNGLNHLQTGASFIQTWSKKPFDASSVTTARSEFVMAYANFTQINTDLHSYEGVGSSIPGLGSRLSVAIRVASAASEIAQAGVSGCDGLALITSRMREPLGVGRGLTTADLEMLGKDLQHVEAEVNQANAQMNSLPLADLHFNVGLSKAVAAFHRYLPTVQALLNETNQILPILPSLLGISSPAFYLVEVLDPTELRPGGGAIKDYGFATFIGGRLSAAHITDVNLLDSQSAAAGNNPNLPAAYSWFKPASQGWNLRDSNLDADFPTAANYAEQNFESEGGRVSLQGVIAITPTLMAEALAITGPINIPALNETVTSKNLFERLRYYQLGPGSNGGGIVLSPQGPPTASKYFMEQLSQLFLTRVRRLPSSTLPALLQLLSNSLRTKDLQVYFNNPTAESLLQLTHNDAKIAPPTGDSLFVVDANIANNTANEFITGALNDQVTIDEHGNVTHHATIRYSWSKTGNIYGSPVYSDYTRVYVPLGSALHVQQGWQVLGTNQAFHHEAWASSFTLTSGQTLTATLSWTEKGMAKKDATGWHYQYLIQRQAGTSWKMNVAVTLPLCASKPHTTSGFTSHGRTEVFSQSLYQDTNLAIDYTC